MVSRWTNFGYLYLLCRRYCASGNIKGTFGGHDGRCHSSAQGYWIRHRGREDTLDEFSAFTGRGAYGLWRKDSLGGDPHLCRHRLGSEWEFVGGHHLPHGPSQQSICKVETAFDLPMDPEGKENPDARKNSLAFVSLEFEYMDADKGSAKQDFQLERQNCSQSGPSPSSPMAARRPMVETHAQIWAQADIEIQRRFGKNVQSALASVGRACCTHGAHSSSSTGSQMSWSSVVAMATTSTQANERQMDRTSPTKIQAI